MASMYGVEGFHFSTPLAPNTWVGNSFTMDVFDNYTTFDFIDNNANDNALTPNTADRIVYNGVSRPVSQIYVIGLTIHLRDGSTFNVPAVSGANATGFRVYNLGGGDYILRPIDNTLTMPGLPPYAAWDSFTFTSYGTTPGTSMTVQNDPFPICFVAGTLIETATGAQRVETLAPGDQVLTADHGLQGLRWLACSRLGPVQAHAHPEQRPIVIEAGALGHGLPLRRLRISPQHRVLLAGSQIRRAFGTDEVLVPAVALLGRRGVRRQGSKHGVDYLHLLFDRHEVIWAEGLPTESFYPGPQAMLTLGTTERVALRKALARTPSGKLRSYRPARPIFAVKHAEKILNALGDQPLCRPDPADRSTLRPVAG